MNCRVPHWWGITSPKHNNKMISIHIFFFWAAVAVLAQQDGYQAGIPVRLLSKNSGRYITVNSDGSVNANGLESGKIVCIQPTVISKCTWHKNLLLDLHEKSLFYLLCRSSHQLPCHLSKTWLSSLWKFLLPCHVPFHWRWHSKGRNSKQWQCWLWASSIWLWIFWCFRLQTGWLLYGLWVEWRAEHLFLWNDYKQLRNFDADQHHL